MFVDLHLHSLKSDGTYSPKEIVKLAHSLGINTISLTDHDTYNGITEAAEIAKLLGITFYGGIEFTAYETEDTYEHILGYGIKDFTSVNEYLDNLRSERINLVHQYIDILRNNGFQEISFEAIAELTPGDHLTIMHIAKWLNKNCNICDGKNAYSLFLGTQGKYHIPEHCHYYDEVIPLIKNAGGIAILAHPFRYHPEFRNDIDAFEKHLVSMIACGLNGIEAYYGTHTEKEVQMCIEIAKKYRLIITGGSDFHGWEDKVPMGVNIPSDLLIQFTDLL